MYLRGLPRNELSGQGELGGPCVYANNILPSAANVGRDSMFIDKKGLFIWRHVYWLVLSKKNCWHINRSNQFSFSFCFIWGTISAPRTVAADYFTHPLRLASVYHHFRDDGKVGFDFVTSLTLFLSKHCFLIQTCKCCFRKRCPRTIKRWQIPTSYSIP